MLLIDHHFGIVADRIERFRDVFIAAAYIHRLGLITHDLVEDFRRPKVREMTAIRSWSRSEIFSSSALIGVKSGRSNPEIAQGPVAWSRYCMGDLINVFHDVPHSLRWRPAAIDVTAINVTAIE